MKQNDNVRFFFSWKGNKYDALLRELGFQEIYLVMTINISRYARIPTLRGRGIYFIIWDAIFNFSKCNWSLYVIKLHKWIWKLEEKKSCCLCQFTTATSKSDKMALNFFTRHSDSNITKICTSTSHIYLELLDYTGHTRTVWTIKCISSAATVYVIHFKQV